MMAALVPPDRTSGEIDEEYLRQWQAYGWVNLLAYLAKVSRFEEWCRSNDRGSP